MPKNLNLKRKLNQNGIGAPRFRRIGGYGKHSGCVYNRFRSPLIGATKDFNREHLPQDELGGEGEQDDYYGENGEDRQQMEVGSDDENDNDNGVMEDIPFVEDVDESGDESVDEDDVNMAEMEAQTALDEEFHLGDLTDTVEEHKAKINLPRVLIMVIYFNSNINFVVLFVFLSYFRRIILIIHL